ncbi:hypothetical protein LENED_004870 [Lentinula edodes]|uniref:Uncharacterized protein n=1 Tax=Lentinula edodes TaxID=5353 RepID=A0A1Q3E7X8_LENED|nr:hypothetical protein LENED_004870 [Lentinula edodes]
MSIGVWFGPGNVLYATEEQRALGFTKFFCQIAPEYQQWIIEDFGPKTRQFKSRVLGPTSAIAGTPFVLGLQWKMSLSALVHNLTQMLHFIVAWGYMKLEGWMN